MNELLTMAKKAKENAEALRTRSKALQEQRLIKEQMWAEEAYKTFHTTLASLDDIEAFEIAPSHGVGSSP